MTRELSHPAVGAPEASVQEVAERLHAFMSDPQHEQQWESLREAGQALMSSMPYTLPWMLGDDATVAASVAAEQEEIIATQEAVLPLHERVAPEWFASHFAEGGAGVRYDQPAAPPQEDEIANEIANPQGASTARDDGTEPGLSRFAGSGHSSFAPAYLPLVGAAGAVTCPPSASPGAPLFPSGFQYLASSAQSHSLGASPVAQTDDSKVVAAPGAGGACGEDAGGPIRTSRFRGVSRRYGKWKARIKQNGSDLVIGDFDDELEAAYAYDAKARQLHGDKAMLNFPVPR
jgi:hypothetical protein